MKIFYIISAIGKPEVKNECFIVHPFSSSDAPGDSVGRSPHPAHDRKLDCRTQERSQWAAR